MRFIGIIPARMDSTRFPGKPLARIGKHPMLYHVWRAALLSRFLEPLYVATPDKEIIEWCEFVGFKYIVTRPDCQSGTERCADAMRQLAMRDPDDIVVNIQGDEPMISPAALDDLARAFIGTDVQIASLCFAPSSPEGFISNPNRVKVLVGESRNALAFTRSVSAAYLWRLYRQHIGVYAYRRDILPRLAAMPVVNGLEQITWMRAGHEIRMVETAHETIAVDEPGDIERVERAMNG